MKPDVKGKTPGHLAGTAQGSEDASPPAPPPHGLELQLRVGTRTKRLRRAGGGGGEAPSRVCVLSYLRWQWPFCPLVRAPGKPALPGLPNVKRHQRAKFM